MKYLNKFNIPLVLILFFSIGCAPALKSQNALKPAKSITEKPATLLLEQNNIPEAANQIYEAARDENTTITKAVSTHSVKDDEVYVASRFEDPDNLFFGEESPSIQEIMDEALDYCDISQDFWQNDEYDNAIECLDYAYSLILKVNAYDKPDLIQQIDDMRFMISKRILEIYASRNNIVKGNHNAIPIVMNSHVKQEIKRFTNGKENSFFWNAYKRSGKYRTMIVEEFKKAGLPTELSWLPLIESGFRSNALSSARALGLWQFIPSTGYKFGLKRDRYIDERMDPEKATKAAIAYLKELHKIFGDWSTVLAAYNCGEGRVLRVIRNQNVNYLDNFWDLYERLPKETARYVPRFLATLHVIKNMEKYGLDKVKPHKPLDFEVVSVSKQVHLADVAKALGVSKATLIEINPELRYHILPPDESYPLRVPKCKKDALLAKISSIPVHTPPERPANSYMTTRKHKVRNGETLSTIAKKYKTTVKLIARANKINRKHFIKVGKVLKIPCKNSGKSVYTSKRSKYRKKSSRRNYVVKSGDTLWVIARRFGTTSKKLKRINNLSGSRLHIGQILKIEGNSSRKYTAKNSRAYYVKRGDVPLEIAKRHNMPLNRLLQINRLTSKSKIFPGQKLIIK